MALRILRALALLSLLYASVQAQPGESNPSFWSQPEGDYPYVHGRVVDDSDLPLPGTRVLLVSEDLAQQTLTDDNGMFSFGCIPDGEYRLEFELEAFHKGTVEFRYEHPYEVIVKQTLSLDARAGERIPWTDHFLLLHVLDEVTQKPVAGASVSLDGEDPIVTNCDGRAALWSDQEPGRNPFSYAKTVRLTVIKQGYANSLRKWNWRPSRGCRLN